MSDRDCPRNHDEPLYRRITDGFLEMPVDFCPACGEWVCTDGTPAPVEPPVLSRAETALKKILAIDYVRFGGTVFGDDGEDVPKKWVTIDGTAYGFDDEEWAILESLSQEEAT